MKFKEDAQIILKNNLENGDLEAINLLMEGKSKCNSVKKAHLEAFRKIIELMSKELNWSEQITTTVEPKTENQEVNSEIATETQQKKVVCKFLKSGNCVHGRSGKKPDQQGKVCSYSHLPICKKHEMQGKCMTNRCKKLHLNLCRRFMETQQCSYGENCRYFHPKGMEEHDKNIHEENKFLNPNVSYSYAQPVKNITSSFLEQNSQIHQPVIG